MKKFANKLIAKYGLKVTTLAIAIASISPMCCRGEWYQPKEPKNISELFEKKWNTTNRN